MHRVILPNDTFCIEWYLLRVVFDTDLLCDTLCLELYLLRDIFFLDLCLVGTKYFLYRMIVTTCCFFDTCLFRDTFCIECKNCADCNFDWNRNFFADDHDHGDGDDSNFRSRPLKEFESRHRQTSRSPGLVVMGDDSCSKGRGFKSLRRILDGHFSHWFVVKIVCLKRQKKTKKRPALAHFKKHLKRPFCIILRLLLNISDCCNF